MVASTGCCTQSPRCMSTRRRIREITSRGLWQSSSGCVIVRSWANLPVYLLSLPCAQEAVNPTHLLAWIPETLLDEKGQSEWDKFVSVEGKAPYDEEEGRFVRVCSRTALIALDAIRCCSHRHADFATRNIRVLRALNLSVLPARLPSEPIFLV
jgi:hypothetical protein